MNDAHGVVTIHSCPQALAQHVEWAISHIVGRIVRLDWIPQPAETDALRAEFEWDGATGTAARIASSLRGWQSTRFEVTEATAHERDGVRFVHTPGLGIFYTLIDAIGNAVVGEDRIRYAMGIAGGDAAELERELSLALGTAWDDELEPYRSVGAEIIPLPARIRAV